MNNNQILIRLKDRRSKRVNWTHTNKHLWSNRSWLNWWWRPQPACTTKLERTVWWHAEHRIWVLPLHLRKHLDRCVAAMAVDWPVACSVVRLLQPLRTERPPDHDDRFPIANERWLMMMMWALWMYATKLPRMRFPVDLSMILAGGCVLPLPHLADPMYDRHQAAVVARMIHRHGHPSKSTLIRPSYVRNVRRFWSLCGRCWVTTNTKSISNAINIQQIRIWFHKS